MDHFGHWLKSEIENRALTQPQFATNAGIPLPTLKKWIGDARPAIRGVNVVRLARGLGVSREDVESKLQRGHQAAA